MNPVMAYELHLVHYTLCSAGRPKGSHFTVFHKQVCSCST